MFVFRFCSICSSGSVLTGVMKVISRANKHLFISVACSVVSFDVCRAGSFPRPRSCAHSLQIRGESRLLKCPERVSLGSTQLAELELECSEGGTGMSSPRTVPKSIHCSGSGGTQTLEERSGDPISDSSGPTECG